MKAFYKVSDYEQWIDIENRVWNCTCPDFTFRQIHKEELGRCKHLIKVFGLLDNEFIKEFKKIQSEEEMPSLTEKQKLVLREMVNFTCQYCHKHEEEVGTLHIHRIREGNKGGEYVPNNLLLICKNCHLNRHYREF